jgi:hypothetical protein
LLDRQASKENLYDLPSTVKKKKKKKKKKNKKQKKCTTFQYCDFYLHAIGGAKLLTYNIK